MRGNADATGDIMPPAGSARNPPRSWRRRAAGSPVLDPLGHRPAAENDHGRAARQRFDHHQPVRHPVGLRPAARAAPARSTRPEFRPRSRRRRAATAPSVRELLRPDRLYGLGPGKRPSGVGTGRKTETSEAESARKRLPPRMSRAEFCLCISRRSRRHRRSESAPHPPALRRRPSSHRPTHRPASPPTRTPQAPRPRRQGRCTRRR